MELWPSISLLKLTHCFDLNVKIWKQWCNVFFFIISLFISLMICTITLTYTEHVFPFQDELEATQEGAVALVAVVNEEEVPAGVPFETHHVSIVLEDQVVMSHRSWTDSLVILFGLIYALHLSYPEKLSGFFEFIQVVLLNLDDGRKQLKPKLQALRNELE